MPYLIDSDWAIDFLDGVSAAVTLLQQLAEDGTSISIISYIEVYQGVARSPDRATAEYKLEQFVTGSTVLPVTIAVARRCAELRESLRRQGRRINSRAMDLIIAATALEHDLTLVTRNTDDYRDIPGLRVHR